MENSYYFKKITLLFFISLSHFSFGQYPTNSEILKMIERHTYLGHNIRSCEDICEFRLLARSIPKTADVVTREHLDAIGLAHEAARNSPFKAIWFPGQQGNCPCQKEGNSGGTDQNSSQQTQTTQQRQRTQSTDPTTTLAQTALSILGNFTGSSSRDKMRAERAARRAQENNNSQESPRSSQSSSRYETQSSTQYETSTNTYDYSTSVQYANIEAGKDTYDGYRNAIKFLEPHVYKLDATGLNSLGYYYWKVKDYSPASKYYKMSGDKGNDWGNNNLALCYQNGWGVAKNNFQAFEYYSKVGSTFERIGETYHQMGHLCVDGANNAAGSSDYNMASSYYSMGITSNNSECMLHLGEFYDTGGQLKTNLTMAKYWYKKACDLKNEKACNKLKALE